MTVVALRRRDGSVVCERCVVAEAPLARMRGLLGRRGLSDGDGLLLRPASSIHMWFMRFAIDAVFLAGDGSVLKVVPNLGPWRIAACRGAKACLELAAGAAERRQVVVGERLALPDRGGLASGPTANHPPVSA